MNRKPINRIAGSLIVSSLLSSYSQAADAIEKHPLHEQLNRIFKSPVPTSFKETGVSRNDYLKLIAGNVDFFIKCQNDLGAIIDPVSKGERQYSTPAFALSAAILVKESGRNDLLEPSIRAMSFALKSLVDKTPADKHADFYIPMLVHAHRILKEIAPKGKVSEWETLFKQIDPETMYRADLKGMNWNVVSSGGELLRRHDGLVADDMKDAQINYLEKCLTGHMDRLHPLGLFEDPGVPMAYDAFTRLWLEDMNADNAYQGKLAAPIQDFLQQGGLSTLLLLSPSGEWIMGGRSALHNWTDLQITAICEINATWWKKQGREDVAGAFKRAAHLAFESAARWQRPSGELNIIKNRAEPEKRLAYEGYSNHSQYNLLPMAMLAIAYARADESIAEKPSPSEVGGYVFDARDKFHKIVAAAGGYYVAIDSAADAHYNATGLQRVHRAGVKFPSLSDSAPPDRSYGPKETPKLGIALGLQWKSADQWIGLADFTEGNDERKIKSTEIKTDTVTPEETSFTVTYQLAGNGGDDRSVIEQYVLNSDGITFKTSSNNLPGEYRLQIPVLVNDGATDIKRDITTKSIFIDNHGSTTIVEFPGSTGRITLQPPKVINHNGFVQRAVLPVTGPEATVRIRLRD